MRFVDTNILVYAEQPDEAAKHAAACDLLRDVWREASLSYWDAAIVAAALNGGATELLTEDLNHGQIIRGVRIRNPLPG